MAEDNRNDGGENVIRLYEVEATQIRTIKMYVAAENPDAAEVTALAHADEEAELWDWFAEGWTTHSPHLIESLADVDEALLTAEVYGPAPDEVWGVEEWDFTPPDLSEVELEEAGQLNALGEV